MISDLPEDVKEKILTYLPIKEAGRTRILSSKWSDTWASIPELVFSDIDSSNLTKFVDTIFILHNGPIHKFKLVTGKDCYRNRTVDRWVGNLARTGIQEITIDLFGSYKYVMHPRFFSCGELNYINLTGCSFKLPLRFKGFKLPHTLELKNLIVSASDIEKIISSSLLLKKMILENLGKFVGLNIHASNLQILEIRDEILDLQVCAPKLLSLYVVMPQLAENPPCNNKTERVLGNVPALKEIKFGRFFVKSISHEPFGDGFSLNPLESMSLNFDFTDEKDAAFVLAMFRRTPHLKLFSLRVFLTKERPTLPIAKFWEAVDRREGLFTHVEKVTIYGFRDVDSVHSFIEFILGSAPQLVTLAIEKDSEDKQYEGSLLRQLQDEVLMLRRLLQCKRASPKAEIIFKSI